MKRLLVVIVLMAFGGMLFAQTAAHDVTMNVGDIALIDLDDTVTVVLDITAPAQGGLDPIGDTDNSKYLQYTSLVAGAARRNITVQWDALDAAPAGTSLSVQITGIAGGSGTRGAYVGAPVTISNVAQNLITGIGSCVTGVGATDGAAVQYNFNVVTPGSLVVGDTETVTVTFTLTVAS
ncbi:MAG: hypothetical protein EHM28_13090 [Spirochaetaceae bacterium]|nr:MAG: hypothetical protein EHM28_13090 [Spirochaetaceae bacterium]